VIGVGGAFAPRNLRDPRSLSAFATFPAERARIAEPARIA